MRRPWHKSVVWQQYPLVTAAVVLAVLGLSVCCGQTQPWWTDLTLAAGARTLSLDGPAFRSIAIDSISDPAHTERRQIWIPDPDGGAILFDIWNSELLTPADAAAYPFIRAWEGAGAHDPLASLRMEYSHRGLFFEVFRPQGIFLGETDPSSNLRVYYRGEGPGAAGVCHAPEGPGVKRLLPEMAVRGSGTTRIYRLALSATGEFTQFHGGTVADGLAAIVSLVNRLNGIYQRELSIRFTLAGGVPNLIFTDPATDPFSNFDVLQLLGQNQAVVDAVIGTAGYDFGHVVCTAPGGAAVEGSVCQISSKAKGASGSLTPQGDPFFVDMVAHEIGHQFGARHTHNNPCNRHAAMAFEPGSGSTIMAYAGICPPNIQPHSDPYFHFASLQEIRYQVEQGTGAACAQLAPNGNHAPVVQLDTTAYVLPKQTPFRLSGAATDPDGHPLTYVWEQMDLGASASPWNPTGSAPVFRSVPPDSSPTRYFPSLAALTAGSPVLGELLPAQPRAYSFRFTARDHYPLGGRYASGRVDLASTSEAGPFRITGITGMNPLVAGSMIRVTWDVAQTDKPPVGCQSVSILLSTDSGRSYTFALASGLPNTGQAWVSLPPVAGAFCRILIQADDHLFFCINDAFFDIQPPSAPGFVLYSDHETFPVCAGTSLEVAVITRPLLGFSQQMSFFLLGLPPGVSGYTVPAQCLPGDTVKVVLSGWQNTIGGTFDLQLAAGAATGATYYLPVKVNVFFSPPEAPTVPRMGSDTSQTGLLPLLTWRRSLAAGAYRLEISASADFSAAQVIGQYTVQDTCWAPSDPLAAGKVYFWRVQALNPCGSGLFSTVQAFFTRPLVCSYYPSSDVPKVLPAMGVHTIQSRLAIPSPANIQQVNVRRLRGVHTWVSDLQVRLIGPDSSAAVLFSSICGDHQDFSLNFSDLSSSANLPCPPISAAIYQPETPLAVFSGKSAQGVWTLEIKDTEHLDGGMLKAWALEVCAPASPGAIPILMANLPVPIQPGYIYPISTAHLEVEDGASSPGEIQFWLLESARHIRLMRGGFWLQPGEGFSQADIDQGVVTAHFSANAAERDSFVFAVTTPLGGWIGPTSFHFFSSTRLPQTAGPHPWRLYPNPVGQEAWLDGPSTGARSVRILDLQGRELARGPLSSGGPPYRWSLPAQNAGVHLLEITDWEGRRFYLNFVVQP